MTVGDLREALAKLDAEQDLLIALDGSFVPIAEVATIDGADFILLRGVSKTPQLRKFTVQEQGMIGHLVRLGFDNERIGKVLGRPSKSVQAARKKLGF
jgi:hypothetical protein